MLSSDTFTYNGKVKTPSVKVKNTAGKDYKFKVRAYDQDDGYILGAYSAVYATATKPKTPELQVSSTTKGKVNFKWSNVAGESGYQIYYADAPKGTYKKLDTYKTNTTKATSSKLRRKKTYYFKVRAYKITDNGKIYSSWSTVKKVKIK